MTEVTPGNDRDKLLKGATITYVIGKKLFEVAFVYALLLGVVMLCVLVVGSY